MQIHTDRLQIRVLAPSDWQGLQKLAVDFEQSAYAAYDRPLPTEEERIQSLCAQFAASGLWFAVLLGQEMIGYICFHEEDGCYDIGFCFHSAHQGRGYAYESCRAVMAYLEENRGVTAFTAGTALANVPSCRLLAKLGFVLQATQQVSFYKDEQGEDILFEGGCFMRKG